jgi:hypothetical protein
MSLFSLSHLVTLFLSVIFSSFIIFWYVKLAREHLILGMLRWILPRADCRVKFALRHLKSCCIKGCTECNPLKPSDNYML